MSLVQRLIKGSPLTAKEYDDNNLYLEALANSGVGAIQDLSEVLAEGNETLGTRIIISDGDSLNMASTTFMSTFTTEVLTGNRAIEFQDKDGTIALLSDIANIPVFDCNDLENCDAITRIVTELTSFFIAIDFEEVEPFSYIAPQSFTIDSIDNPDSISLVITVNGAPYTLEDPISTYDKLVITPDSVGFIKLNCTRI